MIRQWEDDPNQSCGLLFLLCRHNGGRPVCGRKSCILLEMGTLVREPADAALRKAGQEKKPRGERDRSR